jgi:hypothetical protein
MENYDQVGKFENIAENSEGSTKEKMDIYVHLQMMKKDLCSKLLEN